MLRLAVQESVRKGVSPDEGTIMKVIDISWPLIHGKTTEYKDRETLAVELRARFEVDNMEESSLCMGTHTGSHIEGPRHFIREGKTLDQFPLSTFYGSCLVLDCTSVEHAISRSDLEDYDITPGVRVLFKTKNSYLSETDAFYYEFVYLLPDAAEYLAERSVALVGIDYLSVERNQPDHETHKALLSHDIPILEGVRLGHVDQGMYTLCSMPLSISGAEAAPTRAVLLLD